MNKRNKREFLTVWVSPGEDGCHVFEGNCAGMLAIRYAKERAHELIRSKTREPIVAVVRFHIVSPSAMATVGAEGCGGVEAVDCYADWVHEFAPDDDHPYKTFAHTPGGWDHRPVWTHNAGMDS